jgi:sulfite reductase (ferredoxin)
MIEQEILTKTNGRPDFPAASLPAEAPRIRLLGLYDQRQEGLLMQRLKVLGGRLTLEQWRRIAELAMEMTPEFPLHLTTRQDVEFHGLRREDIPALHHALAQAGLTTVGSCGDSIRAVTIDPESGAAADSFDLGPLAALVHDHAQSFPGAFGLPRKFKISFSSDSRGAARPYLNDVGFIANPDGSLRVILAGSLGARPSLGILAYEHIEVNEALPLVTAALRLFAAEGDRQNRSRARLRHVRERLGDAPFLQRVDALFNDEKAKPYPSVPALKLHHGPARPSVKLNVPHGDLAPQDIFALVDSAVRHEARLRIGLTHDLILFGVDRHDLPPRFQAWADAAPVMACPGAHLCGHGVVETWPAADALREALAGSGLVVAVAGCPNNCSHAAVADIGLIGRLKTVDGVKRAHYRLLAGGGLGCSHRLALELHPGLLLEQIGVAVEWLVDQWQRAGTGARQALGEFVAQEHEYLITGLAQFLEFQSWISGPVAPKSR